MRREVNNASFFIKTREYYVGFPKMFSHYPEKIEKEHLKEILECVNEAMQDPNGISTNNVRKIVIGTGRYMILGISGYLHTIMHDIAKEYNYFCDKTETRNSYGFVGFAWDLEVQEEIPFGFPSVDEFTSLLKKEIVPHWKDSENSLWAEKVEKGIAVPYNYNVAVYENDEVIVMDSSALNMQEDKLAVLLNVEEEKLIREAIRLASERRIISLCTDLEVYKEKGSSFMNVTDYRHRSESVVYDNPKKVRKSEIKEEKNKIEQESQFIRIGFKIKNPFKRDMKAKIKEQLFPFMEKLVKNNNMIIHKFFMKDDWLYYIVEHNLEMSCKRLEHFLVKKIIYFRDQRGYFRYIQEVFVEPFEGELNWKEVKSTYNERGSRNDGIDTMIELVSETAEVICDLVRETYNEITGGTTYSRVEERPARYPEEEDTLKKETEAFRKRIEEQYGNHTRTEKSIPKQGNPFDL